MIIEKLEDRELAIKEAEKLPYPVWVIKTKSNPMYLGHELYCITSNPPSSESAWSRTVFTPHRRDYEL